MRRVRPAPGTFPAMASSSRSPRETRADPLEIRGSTYGNEEFDSVAMRGAPLVVNVWYAACPPCRVEAPALEAAHAEYSVLGVGFVGVNTRDKRSEEHTSELQSRGHIVCRLLLAEEK